MSNTFITPSAIAKMALPALRNNMVLGNLVYTDFADEYQKVGDTITIRKPASFVANEHDGTNWVAQAITEGSVAVVLDKVLDVSFEITSKEQSLNMVDFTKQVIEPAAQALANKVDALVAGQYIYIPNWVVSTATPVVSDVIECMTMLNNSKAPMPDRSLVMSATTFGKYMGLEQFSSAEKTASTTALRQAEMGTLFGMGTYFDQNIVTHTPGAGTVLVDLTAGYAAGLNAIHVDGVSAALKVGDLLSIGGYKHVVLTASALSTADQDITIYPALRADVANDDPVTVIAAAYSNSLAFQKNAFGLAVRPMDAPLGGANGSVISAEGLSIRCVMDYDMAAKKNLVTLDLLCGVKTLTPELACRFIRL